MRSVIFLICLCALLLKGYDFVRTGIHHYSVGYFATQHADKRQQIRQSGAHHDNPLFIDAAANYEEDDLFCEDLEEEDEDNDHALWGRKAWWRTRGNSPPDESAGLHYLNKYSRDLLPFCSHLAHIYITQRALRI